MKLLAYYLFAFLFGFAFTSATRAQTFAPGGDKAGEQLITLSKKIDEQNMKIDALSQQILKLELQISSARPGVMIGESTPSALAPTTPAVAAPAAGTTPPSGNAHVVAKGETLTSIAKTHKVGVGELQKFNQITNERALQIGQTIMIPAPGSTSATSPSPATSASP